MGEKDGKGSSVMVNQAPLLTLWAAVVAEVLGFEHDEALTLGRAVAGLNAYSKGVSLGLFSQHPRRSKNSSRRCAKKKR
jgi:hypothetical protein